MELLDCLWTDLEHVVGLRRLEQRVVGLQPLHRGGILPEKGRGSTLTYRTDWNRRKQASDGLLSLRSRRGAGLSCLPCRTSRSSSHHCCRWTMTVLLPAAAVAAVAAAVVAAEEAS